ncbi:MAG: hypothetical protein UZ21_OP11001001135 [Microgenomates bacterium OLB22]|nr:MAG: hypothetical protein UZ21_OP11001001135 [Microgenomates bacterium OLB22]
MSDQEVLLKKITGEVDPIEKARLIQEAVLKYNVPKAKIADLLRVSRPYVSSLLRLLRLPELVIDGYYSGVITLSHLFVIGRLGDHDSMISLYEEILTNNVSSVDVDNLIRQRKHSVGSYPDRTDEKVKKALEEFFHAIDAEASITLIQTRIKGKLIVELRGDTQRTTHFFKTVGHLLRPSLDSLTDTDW